MLLTIVAIVLALGILTRAIKGMFKLTLLGVCALAVYGVCTGMIPLPI